MGLTLAELRGTGRDVLVQCLDCGHSVALTVAGLLEHPLPEQTDVGDISGRMKCAKCEGRNIISFAESERMARSRVGGSVD